MSHIFLILYRNLVFYVEVKGPFQTKTPFRKTFLEAIQHRSLERKGWGNTKLFIYSKQENQILES